MKDEKIIEYLKEFNFWGNENIYFHTMAPQSFSKEEKIYGLRAVTSYKYFIVNKNENGITVIPFDLTGKSIADDAIIIPNDNISTIYTEKYKFLLVFSGTRLVIKTKDNKVLELAYIKNNHNMNTLLSIF